MSRYSIFLLAIAAIILGSQQAKAQVVDTLEIPNCLFNELYAAGLISPSQIWLRGPKRLYDSVFALVEAPDIERLEQIGKIVAPYPLTDFPSVMMGIAGQPFTRAGPPAFPVLERQYDVDPRHDLDPDLLMQAFDLACSIQQSRNKRLKGSVYAVHDVVHKTGPASFLPVLTSEWIGEELNPLARIQHLGLATLQLERVQEGITDQLHQESMKDWDSVLVIVDVCTPSYSQPIVAFRLDLSLPHDEQAGCSLEDFDFENHFEPVLTIPTFSHQLKPRYPNSYDILEIIQNSLVPNVQKEEVFAIGHTLSKSLREQWFVHEDSILLANEIPSEDGRELVDRVLCEYQDSGSVSRGQVIRAIRRCYPEYEIEDFGDAFIDRLHSISETLVYNRLSMPSKYFVVRRDSTIALLMGFPKKRGVGEAVVYHGKDLHRLLESFDPEVRDRLEKTVRYDLCDIYPFHVPLQEKSWK